MFDLNEFIKRALRYIIEGLVVGVAAVLLLKKKADIEEIIIISLTASATFALLDTFMAPSIGANVRNGIAGTLGVNLAGGLRLA